MADGAPAAPAAPAALALTAAVDAAATLGLTLACIQDGPLTAALLPRIHDMRLAAIASLGDILAASGLRVAATLGLISCGASGAGLASAAVVHGIVCVWLVAKACLTVAHVGGHVIGGQLKVGPVTLRVLPLVITEAVGVLFSGVLLAQVAAFRRVLRMRAPPDALSALAPLQPEARAWLEQRAAARAAAVRQWLDASAAGPSSSSSTYLGLAPGSPPRAGGGKAGTSNAKGSGSGGEAGGTGGASTSSGGGWLQGWGRSARPVSAQSPPRQQLVAAAAARRATAAAADDAAEAGLSRPLLSGQGVVSGGDMWGSGSDDVEFESCAAASRGFGGSLAASSFATAPSEQQEGD